MKNIGLGIFCSLLFASLTSDAQITITSADIATPGRIIYQATDSLPSISVGPAGANQIWNFSGSLNAHILDSLTFMQVADAPNNLDFPTANVISPLNSAGDVLYMNNDALSLTVLAKAEKKVLYIGGEIETLIRTNSPAEKVLEFPATYGTTFNASHYSFSQYFFGSVPSIVVNTNAARGCGLADSMKETAGINKTILVDAWGSITTSAGTYDVIRVKETKFTKDSISAHDALLNAWFLLKSTIDSTVTYYWYANNVGVPLLTAITDSTGAVAKAIWLTNPPATVGITDNSSLINSNVFPNPAQNVICFGFNHAAVSSVQVFDISGKLVEEVLTNGNQTSLTVSGYSNGMYTFATLGKDKKILSRGKFIVSK